MERERPKALAMSIAASATATRTDAVVAALMLSVRPIAARFGPPRNVSSRSFTVGERVVRIDKKRKFDSFSVVC
jgi:hypothetical protein